MTPTELKKEAKVFPLTIQYEDKYWNIEYKEGKMITSTNMELDKASEILFETLKSKLQEMADRSHNQAIDQAIEVVKSHTSVSNEGRITIDRIAQALEKLKI